MERPLNEGQCDLFFCIRRLLQSESASLDVVVRIYPISHLGRAVPFIFAKHLPMGWESYRVAIPRSYTHRVFSLRVEDLLNPITASPRSKTYTQKLFVFGIK